MRLALAAMLFAAAWQATVADTVTLQSGEKLEGRILTETETDYVMEVQVSESILDRKTIAKSEVASVDRTTPDEAAYEELRGLELEPDSLPKEEYKRMIDRLEEFLAQFPDSAHAADVEKKAGAFREESERVEAGDVKLDGEWIEASEVLGRRDEIEARKTFSSMRRATERGNYVDALNAFSRIEEEFDGEAVYPEAVDLARKAVGALRTQLERLGRSLERYESEFEQGVLLAPSHRQEELRAAREKQLENYRAIIEEAEESGRDWVPLIPRSPESLEELGKSADKLESQLAKVETGDMKESLDITSTLADKIDAGDFEGVEEIADQARDLWKDNATLERVTEGLDQKIKAAEEAARLAAEAGKKAEEERLAAEQREREREKARAERAEQKAALQAEQPKSARADGEKPFYMTIPGALAILVGVLVILALVALVGKRGKKQAE